MARTDDVPIRITAPEYKPSGQGDLETWLGKEAADAQEARGRGKIEDNEQASTVNYGDIYETPEGRRDGANVEGNWGEPPHMAGGRQEPFHQNDATYAVSKDVREGVVRRAFDTFPAAQQQAHAALAQNLDHARTGDFTTHSVILQSKTKEGSASLADRVRALTGRF